jgi:predicted translin family RNA/ssDNA-binding protein
MLNHESFIELEAYLKEEDAKREEIINTSRIILKNSKSAIYSLHRKELEQAKELIDDSKRLITHLKKITEKHPYLKQSMENALEEYCEACCFYGFINDKNIPTYKELDLEPYTYLGGLSDLTGELGRRSVLEAIARNKDEIKLIRDLVDEIYGVFAKLDLRNGELRKKGDAIKWNLNKIEEVLHDAYKRD